MAVKLNYDGWGFLPFIPTPGTPPATGNYQVGLTLEEACKEFWLSKTMQFDWGWSYVSNIISRDTPPFNDGNPPPGSALTFSGSLTAVSLPSPADATVSDLPDRRVTYESYGQISGSQGGYTSGYQADEVFAAFEILWYQCYTSGGLIYPCIFIATGGVEANDLQTDITAWPSATGTVFGKAITLYDSEDPTDIEGGAKTGSVTLATTEYWS